MNYKRERYQQGSLTIERRSSGPDVWVYRWRKAGIRRKKILGSVKQLTKTQAQKKAITCTEDSARVSELTNLNVSELVEHYKERELREDSGKAAKPRKAYLYIFANYILPMWGSLSLGQVKAVAVEDWLKTLPLANGSKAKIREVFGAAFRHAMRHELHTTNPIANVRQVRKRAIDPEILEPEEIAAIHKQLEGIEPVRTAFLIAAVMGMRRGEIFGLKWSDVDLGRALLHVRRSYVDGVEGPPKTESSRRPLPLPPQVIDALNAWKAISKYTKQDQWVFASDFHFGNQPLWPGTLWRRNVVPAIEAAGISKPKLGWHTLRRSYASLLLSSGVNLPSQHGAPMRHATAGDDACSICTVGRGREERSRRKNRFSCLG